MLPTFARSLTLLVFVLLAHLAQLRGEELQLDLSAAEPKLQINMENDTLGHYRVEYSSDLGSWQTAGSLGLLDGDGEWTLESSQLNTSSMFFRVVEDDSVENVLDLPETPDDYETIVWPDHLITEEVLATDNTPANNEVMDETALLGRVLFYDKKLSANYTVSCASCHQQENGFSDPDTFSRGFDGGLTGRNSMGLTNAQFYEPGHFFWDERADTLEGQVLEPIQNEVEMGLTLEEAVERVGSYSYYSSLFIGAFGDSEVTSDRIASALAQFVRSIVSSNSKYDIGVETNFANFTTEEQLGHDLFHGSAKCSACHEGPNFVGSRAENNGLEFPYIDTGVGGISGRDRDMGKFKMSSLRNIEKTAPYMHDGRFATLEEVVEFYNSEVVDNPNIGRPLLNQEGEVLRLNLSESEKDALVAFMLTLTDESVLTGPKWSDPFADGAQ